MVQNSFPRLTRSHESVQVAAYHRIWFLQRMLTVGLKRFVGMRERFFAQTVTEMGRSFLGVGLVVPFSIKLGGGD